MLTMLFTVSTTYLRQIPNYKSVDYEVKTRSQPNRFGLFFEVSIP